MAKSSPGLAFAISGWGYARRRPRPCGPALRALIFASASGISPWQCPACPSCGCRFCRRD